MSDEWNSYICNVNDKLASIFVDIGIRPHVPDESKPWLLWVWVYFKKPRLDGLSSGEEFDILISLEDKLVASMQQSCDAILSGRITTDGRREFYFYAPKSEGFDRAVRASLGSFHGYKFDFNKQRDSGWTQYLNVLYPSEEQLELIGNRDLLDSLKRRVTIWKKQETFAIGHTLTARLIGKFFERRFWLWATGLYLKTSTLRAIVSLGFA